MGSICFKESLVLDLKIYILCLLDILIRVSQNRMIHLIGFCDQISNLLM